VTELRDYQNTAVDDIEAALDAGAKVLYVLPTVPARPWLQPPSSSGRCRPASTC
jgi:hypothetical protein